MDHPLYHLPSGVHPRWASCENPDATPGAAGQALSGRKGAPSRALAAGESFVLAHAEGTSGLVRRLWITINDRSPALLRGIVLRIWWEDEAKPAVEAPLGDFFGVGLGRTAAFESAWCDNPEGRSFTCRWPMPFRRAFRLEATNESGVDLAHFFYDVNFTVGDRHDADTGWFHTHWRRENPTTLRRDFEILPRVTGRGRYLGANLGVIADTARYGQTWWGEGEVKVYLDGDTDLPTLCGTGTEDYIATGWGQGRYDRQWHGCTVADHERMEYCFYRLHGPDPVLFERDCRVTIQQIGCCNRLDLLKLYERQQGEPLLKCGDGTEVWTRAALEDEALGYGLYERADDWSATAWFYLDRPSSELPALAGFAERVAGLQQ